jgi:hypothetical protein
MNLLQKTSLYVITLLFSIPQFSLAATFSDLPESNDYYIAVESLVQSGILQGYDDGTFKPEREVNRAEALKMILKSANIQVGGGLYNTGFPDVPIDSWYAGYVMEGTLRGIIKGNPDGTFAGARTVNEAEFLKMTLESFEMDLSKHQNVDDWISADAAPGEWFIPYLSYAKTIGLVYPDLNYNLYPGKTLARGQCAQILYKMLVIEQGGQGQKLLSIAESKLVEALIMIHRDNIEEALSLANQAVDYSQQALDIEPDSTVTKATNTIAKAFQKLFSAYLAGINQNSQEVASLAQEAKDLADQAVKQNESANFFASKVHEHANALLSQLQ